MTTKINYKKLEKWEKNYLGITTNQDKSRLYYYFKFLNSKLLKKIPGDIVEAGVYQGSCLISTALLLKQKKNLKNKKIWGYDTFQGFPKLSSLDDPKKFGLLFNKNKISKSHYTNVLKLKKIHRYFKSRKITPRNISTSNNFDNTSVVFLKKKFKFFKVSKNINLIKGDFKDTMKNKKNLPKQICAGLIDCDLFEGYKDSSKFLWPKLSINGKLFLDEYFSLKFPGPRFAVDEFVKSTKNAKLIKEGITENFERWSIKKVK